MNTWDKPGTLTCCAIRYSHLETALERTPDMEILAIVQSKGGTGKTTIGLNLLAAAAESGHKALLVDTDHHAAGSTLLVGFVPPERSLYAVLKDSVHPRSVVQHLPKLNCLVLPGSYALLDLPSVLPLNALADNMKALASEPLEVQGAPYSPDLVIIDCPGGDVAMTRMALYAADHVAIPMSFSALDLTANETTINLIAAIRDLRGAKPGLAGLIPNRIQRGDTVARDLAFLIASRMPLLPAIPESNLIRRTGSSANVEHRLVVNSHPKSLAAERFRLLYQVLFGGRRWSREDGLENLAAQLKTTVDWLVPDSGAAAPAATLQSAA